MLVLSGLSPSHHALRGQQGFQQRSRIVEMNAFVLQNLGHAADQRIGVLSRKPSQQLQQAPIRPYGGKNICVLDLPCHHHLMDPFAFQNLDQAAQLAE